MDNKGIHKPSRWSYIEFSGEVKEIKLMLKDMTMKLKTACHAPITTQLAFDGDEEEKETLVSYHSEKLALSFGLINSSPEETIRIKGFFGFVLAVTQPLSSFQKFVGSTISKMELAFCMNFW